MKWLIALFLFTSCVAGQAQMPIAHGQQMPRPADPPAIRSFAFAPVAFSSGRFVFTWDASGAREGTIFVLADCMPGTTILSRGLDSGADTPFACGILHGLPASRGSINLEFANRSGHSEIEFVRLYVAGSASVCSTMAVPVSAER